MARDLSPVVDRLGQDYTVTRPGDTVYVQGHPTQGASSTFTARGVLFPATREQLERLPAGDDNRAAKGFITTTRLRVSEPGGAKGDLLSAEGAQWECHAAASYTPDGRFWDCVLVRVGDS